jgi:hypothetical protein
LPLRIAVIVALVTGFVLFHLMERLWHGTRPPSFSEELLFIGGLVVGVFEATVKQMTLTVTAVPGLATVAVFGLILVVLLVRPQGLLGSRAAA